MRAVIAVLLGMGLVAPSEAIWSYGSDTFNCKMRALAYEYGKKTLPRFKKFENLYYALGLNAECHDEVPPPVFDSGDLEPPPPAYDSPADAYFVDYVMGSDSNPGTIDKPFKTIQHAVDSVPGRSTVNLRRGTHYLTKTVQITARSSGLVIQNYGGEAVTVSGGKLLDVKWSPFDASGGGNKYVADVVGQVSEVPGFQVNGVRATRARFPNGNVELPERQVEGGNPDGIQYIKANEAAWTPPDLSKQGKQTYVTNTNPSQMRNFTDYGFQEYMVGIGGPCSIYEPPVAYWCAEHVSGGGAFAFRVPRGFTPNKSVIAPQGGDKDAGLHMPYKNPASAILNVYHPHRWASWMFDLQDYDSATNNITFGKGGFQGARGGNTGGDFFVENVFEEFDYPNEFFHDAAAGKIYYYHNGTGPPPADAEYVAPQIATLFSLTSSRWNPIKDVTIRGLKLTAARYTYMEAHGVPSGGDWALDRMGAVFLEGTEGVVVEGCHLTRLDGNGVFVSGYNRDATIQNNEFSWIGGNAMAGWGYTNETGANPLQGFDGTDGNHPQRTRIINNLAREVGHYEKQSSFWFQAKTALTVIQGNVFFNGPRAGINLNDGFGGGDFIQKNLMFSTCRETGDHGPVNTWDRQPFLTNIRTGQPSVQMQWRDISYNFFIDNYNLQENIDNDDGSSYFHTHDNFLVSGDSGMKNDYGGHDNYHYNNIYAYIKYGFRICSQKEGHVDAFFNNTLVMTTGTVGTGEGCSGPGKTIVHDLTIYASTNNATECGFSPPRSPGTTVHPLPSDDFIINLARDKLNIH